jgi:membrane protease YdiL (CAAX protease family)
MPSPFCARQARPGGILPQSANLLDQQKIPLTTALVYLILIAVAELLTTFSVPQAGLALHGGLLIVLLTHTAIVSRHSYHRLLLSLTIAPLIRMLSLSLPLARYPILHWYLIISVPLLLATILTARALGLSRVQMGLTVRQLPWQLLIAATGLVFGVVEYYILRPGPLIESPSWQNLLPAFLILMVCTGFAEELIFRGVIQRTAMQALGRFGLTYVALLFAVLHVGYKSFFDVVFVFVVALVFGWAVEKTGSLLGVTLAHGFTNAILFLVMPVWG